MSGFWDPPDSAKEGQSRIRPYSRGLRPVRTVGDALPYLSSPELGAALSLSRTGSEPAKPGAALNLRPPETGAWCAPADLRQRQSLRAGGVGVPGTLQAGPVMGCQRSEKTSELQAPAGRGGCQRQSGLGEGWGRRRAQLESGLTSGVGRAAAQCSQRSGVRGAGAARKRGIPEGLVTAAPSAASPGVRAPLSPLAAPRAPGRGGTL